MSKTQHIISGNGSATGRKDAEVLKGSISVGYKRCGNLCRRCRKGKGHRCIYFSYRYRGKTFVVHIPKEKEKLARKWHNNYLKIREILEDLTRKNLRILKEKRP